MLSTILLDILGILSGYKEKYTSTIEELTHTKASLDSQIKQYNELKAENEVFQAELNKALSLAQEIKKELDLWQN